MALLYPGIWVCIVMLIFARHVTTNALSILTKSLQVLYSSAEASMLWKAMWLYLLVNFNKNVVTFTLTVLWSLREDHREACPRKCGTTFATTARVAERAPTFTVCAGSPTSSTSVVRSAPSGTTDTAWASCSARRKKMTSATQILSTTDPTCGCAWSRRWDGPRPSGKPSRPSGAPPERTSKSTVNHK